MNLSEHDAYALRRAVAMLDVPDDLVLSPLVAALLKTLKWKDNSAHWSLLQQILSSDPAISTHLLQIESTRTAQYR